jgi:AraC-like DNA-binding protein
VSRRDGFGTGRAPVPASFATAEVPELKRIASWEHHNAHALIGLRCRTMTSGFLDAEELNVQFRDVHLARVRGSAHVVERDADLIERSPTESIALFFGLAGEAFFYSEDAVHTTRPGQLIVCDADRPFMRGFSAGLEELVLTVPRELIPDLMGTDRHRATAVLNFDTTVGGDNMAAIAAALASRIGTAVRAQDPRPTDEETLLDLVRALLGGGGRQPSVHLAAIEAYVDRHLSDSQLTAGRVAAAVGVSSRHLSRVLGDTGQSFPGLLMNRRLDAAHALLRRADGEKLPVADVARRCGFASASHFSHAFAVRFDQRATDVRREAIAARALHQTVAYLRGSATTSHTRPLRGTGRSHAM